MTLKLAFIGGGVNSAVGYTHLVASQMDGHFEVVAGAFSTDPQINQRSGKTYGLSPDRIFDSWVAMIEELGDDLDAVAVLTPTPSHCEIVLRVLRSGLDVICEKSLATSSADAQFIAEVADEHGRQCLVTFNYSGYPAIREIRRRVLGGELGSIRQIAIEMPQEGFLRKGASPQDWRIRDYELPTVSLDLGVHVAHLAEFVAPCGTTTSIASTECHSGLVADVVDNVNVLAIYENGAMGNFWWSKAALGYRNGLRVRVFGSDAAMEWHQMNPEDLLVSYSDGRRELIDRGCGQSVPELEKPTYNRFKPGHPAGFIEAFANLYADFSALLQDQNKPDSELHSAQAAVRGLRFLEDVHRNPTRKSP